MRLFNVLFVVLMIFLIGCSNNPTSSNTKIGSVKIVIRTSTASAAKSLNASQNVKSGIATITSARVVIEKIKFESSIDDTLDFRFRQPFIQDLTVGSNVHVIETVQVPFGSYKESEIEIDDLDPEDGAVYTQNPELQDLSILVKGFVNDDSNQNFIFTSDLSEEQEKEFNPPLVLDENSPSTNVVLFINMEQWFVDQNGNPLDPRSPANKEIVEDNIKASIDVFEDHDDDGKRDDGDEDDD